MCKVSVCKLFLFWRRMSSFVVHEMCTVGVLTNCYHGSCHNKSITCVKNTKKDIYILEWWDVLLHFLLMCPNSIWLPPDRLTSVSMLSRDLYVCSQGLSTTCFCFLYFNFCNCFVEMLADNVLVIVRTIGIDLLFRHYKKMWSLEIIL